MKSASISSREVCELIGCSRGRLHQLRNGYTNRKKWYSEPVLIEGVDWWWDKGAIRYKREAVERLRVGR